MLHEAKMTQNKSLTEEHIRLLRSIQGSFHSFAVLLQSSPKIAIVLLSNVLKHAASSQDLVGVATIHLLIWAAIIALQSPL